MNKNRSKNQRSSKGKQQKKSKTAKTYQDVKRECRGEWMNVRVWVGE